MYRPLLAAVATTAPVHVKERFRNGAEHLLGDGEAIMAMPPLLRLRAGGRAASDGSRSQRRREL
jgi:hypothetical protein